MKYVQSFDECSQQRGWTDPQQCIGEDFIFLNYYGNYEQKKVLNITTVEGITYVVFMGKQILRNIPLHEVYFLQACPKAAGKKLLVTKWTKKDIEDYNRSAEAISICEDNFGGNGPTAGPNYYEDFTSLYNIVCTYYGCKKITVKLEARECVDSPYYDTVPDDVYDSEYKIRSIEDLNSFLEWCEG